MYIHIGNGKMVTGSEVVCVLNTGTVQWTMKESASRTAVVLDKRVVFTDIDSKTIKGRATVAE